MASGRRCAFGGDLTLASPADLCGRSASARRFSATTKHRRIVRRQALSLPYRPCRFSLRRLPSSGRRLRRHRRQSAPQVSRWALTRLVVVPRCALRTRPLPVAKYADRERPCAGEFVGKPPLGRVLVNPPLISSLGVAFTDQHANTLRGMSSDANHAVFPPEGLQCNGQF